MDCAQTVSLASSNEINIEPVVNQPQPATSVSDDLNLRKKGKKRERSPNSSIVQPNESSVSQNQHGNAAATVNNPKKEKQRPETWNKIEQQIFFNALRQNGKNFESITQYFNARQKRYKQEDGVTNASVQRSKEQIRHFYYRTWHKIIKYISIPLKKEFNNNNANNNSASSASNATQNNPINPNYCIFVNGASLRDIQVKCLIAFNTLMNKSHSKVEQKSALKLVELVNHGWTTIREKGKITRLRMPICKISTKIVQANEVESNENNHAANNISKNNQSNSCNLDDNSTPKSFSIQLEPKNDSAFCRVHSLAQNPYLTIQVQAFRTVKYLIEFLENKWKSGASNLVDRFQQVKDENSNETSNKKLQFTKLYPNLDRLVLYPDESHQINVSELKNSDDLVKKIIGITDPKGILEKNNAFESMIDSNNKEFTTDTILDLNSILCIQNECANSAVIQSQDKTSDVNATNTAIKERALLNSDLKINELTFEQLFSILNKPKKIKLKYEWIVPINRDINNKLKYTSSESSSSTSLFMTLTSSHNKQQRFYLDTLASVANSFLNDMVKTSTNKNESNSSSNNKSNNSNNNVTNSISLTANVVQPIINEAQQVFIAPKPPVTIAQPTGSPTTSLESDKTKRLLSDLNSKRRSRQRKPIMIVNGSSHNHQRNLFNKFDIINGTKPSETANTTNPDAQQQNIVYSGPIAAVARQLVNTDVSHVYTQKQTTNKNPTTPTTPTTSATMNTRSDSSNQNSCKALIPSSFQQTYSNLIPKILNNLMDSASGVDATTSDLNDNNKQLIDCEENIDTSTQISAISNMSLLDLSINNADSLFNSVNNQNNNENNNNNNLNPVINLTSMTQVNVNEQIQTTNMNDPNSNIITNMGDLFAKQNNGVDQTFSTLQPTSSHNCSGEFNITPKRSDLIVEWTDSMNDVSLTGCFLNELQTPEKASKNGLVHVLNENSQNSLFFSMDTFMEMLPASINPISATTVNRYEDNGIHMLNNQSSAQTSSIILNDNTKN